MIYDELGLPKVTGATDLQDSAHAAGMLTLFNYGPKIPLELYVDLNKKSYVRHPKEAHYDFSRDQSIPLVAGLYKQNLEHLVDRAFITGKDIITPDVQGHLKRCKSLKANWIQDAWLKAAILWHAKRTPLDEPNNVIAMSMVAGLDYVRFWKKHNYTWRTSIFNYWGGWRGEQGFAIHLIDQLEKI